MADLTLSDDDYISPGLEVVLVDAAFPNMIIGTKSSNTWPYLRREIGHHWYVDRRNPTVGFLSRDEAMLLFNIARQHFGKPCLEIGCWRGWSTAHMALGAGNLEVIDPVLADAEFREDVVLSLQRAGVRSSVALHVGSSPDMVAQLCEKTGKRWSLVFIDGDHEGDAPRLDAEIVHRYACEDAAILLHDLTSPHVAAALAWLHDHGWTTAIYQTMQIMGIAVRGAAKPVTHLPDQRQRWTLPRHLASFPVIGETRGLRLHRIVADLEGRPPELTMEAANSGLNVLPDVDAKALDALLEWVAGSLHRQCEVTTSFDELQARYLRMIDRLTKREAESDLSQEFARLQAKHIEALSRAADLEYQLDALRTESETVGRQLRQGQAVARDLTVERDMLAKMFDRVQQKHVEVLRQLIQPEARFRQANVHAEDARRADEATARALAAENFEEMRGAIDRFASWMTRWRVLFGLSRRLLAGRTGEVRCLIENNLRASGVPTTLIPAAIWLCRPRVVFGLARRRALAGLVSVHDHLALSLERSFDISWVGMQDATRAALNTGELDNQLGELRAQLTTYQKRFAALEAAKLADEKALLEADLTIARLRKRQEAQSG